MKGRPVKDGDPQLHRDTAPLIRPLNERPSRKGRRRLTIRPHRHHRYLPSMKGRPVKDGDGDTRRGSHPRGNPSMKGRPVKDGDLATQAVIHAVYGPQ